MKRVLKGILGMIVYILVRLILGEFVSTDNVDIYIGVYFNLGVWFCLFLNQDRKGTQNGDM